MAVEVINPSGPAKSTPTTVAVQNTQPHRPQLRQQRDIGVPERGKESWPSTGAHAVDDVELGSAPTPDGNRGPTSQRPPIHENPVPLGSWPEKLAALPSCRGLPAEPGWVCCRRSRSVDLQVGPDGPEVIQMSNYADLGNLMPVSKSGGSPPEVAAIDRASR